MFDSDLFFKFLFMLVSCLCWGLVYLFDQGCRVFWALPLALWLISFFLSPLCVCRNHSFRIGFSFYVLAPLCVGTNGISAFVERTDLLSIFSSPFNFMCQR